MKTRGTGIFASNGDGKKAKKNTNGLPKINVDVAPTEPVNSLELLRVLTEVKNGNFTVRMPIDEVGLSGKINDTINQMITNLRENTLRSQDQDWLKSNLARFAVMLQGQKDLSTVTKRILSELAPVVTAHYGAFYILKKDEATEVVKLKLYSAYANDGINIPKEFSIGESLVGQCAFEKKKILVRNVPKGYIKISSGLGKSSPSHLIILPVLFEDKVKAVIELASLDSFSETHIDFLSQVTESIGIVLNTIEASTRTVELLEQSQSQAKELKTQQEELRITNEELQVKALLLVKQNEEVEAKNKELAFQNDEKEKRAAELSVANTELAFQNDEKESRAAELSIANKELAFQNNEKERRAAELSIANKELAFQNDEREKRAAELIVANKELAFQNDEKEKRAAELSLANRKVEESRKSLEKKAEQLALTSKYKSEFLANMSHELRSPLNSLLILAQQLYENSEGNLSDKQVRYAKTIHSCGDDLIQLINDILDLSKIESGIISSNISTVRIAEITSFIETTYKPISDARNIKFRIETDDYLPATMDTDMQRLNQILKNLLSNAFKFTEHGEVSLKISQVESNWKSGNPTLDQAKKVVSFSISDTGIGIPAEKQLVIFEAFQQAEGSTSRKYGGTGLGLSISRGLVELLGGIIEVKSQEGHGSTFTVYLPLKTIPNLPAREALKEAKVIQLLKPQREESEKYLSGVSVAPNYEKEMENIEFAPDSINETGDDREHTKPGEKVILVAEHDLRFGKIMIEKAHENGLKAIVAASYQEVFDFTNRFSPMAITLDVNMPTTSGWKVMQMLRSDLMYSHIPIHVISGEENRVMSMKNGARSFLLKPLENGTLNQLFTDIISFNQKETKHILIVEDNEIDASQIAKMLRDDNIRITVAETSKYALECIAKEDYDCIILDYTLPDISGDDLIHEVSKAKKIFTPMIVYSVREFTNIEMNNVNFVANAAITKQVNSIESLLTETVSQLHINHKDLSTDKRKIIENIRNQRDVLNRRSILVVDDDIRNLFAMTTVFERFNMDVITAESGKEAISILMENPKIEMVLMDIMMPNMDGYETTKQIRLQHKNSALPIIAVTAKAMKKDREKCIEAGASDYITKPVRTDQLLSLMRLWFCKQ